MRRQMARAGRLQRVRELAPHMSEQGRRMLFDDIKAEEEEREVAYAEGSVRRAIKNSLKNGSLDEAAAQEAMMRLEAGDMKGAMDAVSTAHQEWAKENERDIRWMRTRAELEAGPMSPQALAAMDPVAAQYFVTQIGLLEQTRQDLSAEDMREAVARVQRDAHAMHYTAIREQRLRQGSAGGPGENEMLALYDRKVEDFLEEFPQATLDEAEAAISQQLQMPRVYAPYAQRHSPRATTKPSNGKPTAKPKPKAAKGKSRADFGEDEWNKIVNDLAALLKKKGTTRAAIVKFWKDLGIDPDELSPEDLQLIQGIVTGS
jgi:hypothetical protein